jgi:hypothetical protein
MASRSRFDSADWAFPIVFAIFLAAAPFFLAPAATAAFFTSPGTWGWMGRLLEAFLPNMAATFVGVVLGLQAAKWANEQAFAAAEKQRRREEDQRLVNALQAVLDALRHNREQFRGLSTILAESGAPFEPQLHAAVWEAVRPEITPYLHDPALSAALANHFSAVESLAALIRYFFEFSTGVALAVRGSQATRASLHQYLLNRMAALDQEADALMARSDIVIAARREGRNAGAASGGVVLPSTEAAVDTRR